MRAFAKSDDVEGCADKVKPILLAGNIDLIVRRTKRAFPGNGDARAIEDH